MNLFKFLGTGIAAGLTAHQPTLQQVLKTPKQKTAADFIAIDKAAQRRKQRAAKKGAK